jgi:peptidyl-tRNA hydrolase, PTH1 family
MFVVVGLGNPDNKYLKTRHNAGFLFLDYLFDKAKNKSTKEEGNFISSDIKIKGLNFKLIKPMTYMNLSGDAVKKVTGRMKVKDKNFNISKDLIIVHDDVDLVPGKIKIKEKGSDAGHNGIKDIVEKLGTDNFLRLRIGIGKEGFDTSNYVLDKFKKEEWDSLWEDTFPRIYRFLIEYKKLGLSKARTRITEAI